MLEHTIFFSNFQKHHLKFWNNVSSRRFTLWQYGLWSFQTTKLERFLPKKQHTLRMLLHWYSSMKKKDSENFWHRKLTLKVKRLGDFAFFDTSPLTQFSKFYKILWVCCFLGKNLSNFVPPVWKLHIPYCHTVHQPILTAPWSVRGQINQIIFDLKKTLILTFIFQHLSS